MWILSLENLQFLRILGLNAKRIKKKQRSKLELVEFPQTQLWILKVLNSPPARWGLLDFITVVLGMGASKRPCVFEVFGVGCDNVHISCVQGDATWMLRWCYVDHTVMLRWGAVEATVDTLMLLWSCPVATLMLCWLYVDVTF